LVHRHARARRQTGSGTLSITKTSPVAKVAARRSTASLRRWARAWKRRLKRESESERAGEVAHAAQDAQGTLVVVGELAGGDHPDGEHFAIAGLGATIGAMPHRAQQVVKHAVDGSNQRVVHRRFLPRRAVSAPPFSGMTPMNDD
jgi:hypothetical protein